MSSHLQEKADGSRSRAHDSSELEAHGTEVKAVDDFDYLGLELAVNYEVVEAGKNIPAYAAAAAVAVEVGFGDDSHERSVLVLVPVEGPAPGLTNPAA